jgi:hypothetical protein
MNDTTPAQGMLMKILPGADRKRSPCMYCYRITYRNPDMHEPGCMMTWEVVGGRGSYQVALERVGEDKLKWHCTCADAIYRGEQANHTCKHVKGLRECLPLAA